MRIFLSITLMFAIAFSGCTVEDIDVNYGEKVSGTYALGSYENQLGVYDLNVNDNVIITRINDNRVIIYVDFYNSTDDIIADDVMLAQNGASYNLSQTYRYSALSGKINPKYLTFGLDYNNGNFDLITAVK
ncbi:MAG: hypothetical protein J7604_17790 [Sporocytophaga sp.]|uniref:hypothetical protein n=1 Tax=Sporocytophaga sp. TaxID=2231183 RepID=UPI001B200AB1|nr:hypothetical protein [Sporocytophaga sp.]MBO9702065.1 hypothetical protein [Sporocytophaga sp.]